MAQSKYQNSQGVVTTLLFTLVMATNLSIMKIHITYIYWPGKDLLLRHLGYGDAIDHLADSACVIAYNVKRIDIWHVNTKKVH